MDIRNRKFSITIPAFNEEETIEAVVNNAVSAAAKISSNFEILLVDDGSTDSTLIKIKKLKKKYPAKIRIIVHKQNQGFSGALKSCYKNAKGDFIFLGPADGQFNYSEIKLFAKKINSFDIVVAYRAINEENLRRKINSFLFHMLSRILFGIKLREFSTCMMYTKKVRDSIDIKASPSSALFLPEFFYKSIHKGYKIESVPIHFYKRKGGKQKGNSVRVIIKTLDQMLKFWFYIHFKKQF